MAPTKAKKSAAAAPAQKRPAADGARAPAKKRAAAPAAGQDMALTPPAAPPPSTAIEAALLNQAAMMTALEQVLAQLDRQAAQLSEIQRKMDSRQAVEEPEETPAPAAGREFPHGVLADAGAVAALAGRGRVSLAFAGAPRPLDEAAAAMKAGVEVLVCEPSALRCESVSRTGVPAVNTLLGAKPGMVGYDPIAGEIFDAGDAALVVPVARLDEVMPRSLRVVLVAQQKALAAVAAQGAERIKLAAVALRGEDTASPDRLRWPVGLIVRDEPGSPRATVLWFAAPRERAGLLDWCRAELPPSQFAPL